MLVVRFSSLGDVILTTPLLRVLRAALPAAELTFATKAAYAPIVAHNPNLTHVEALAPGEPVTHLARRLAARGFDRCLDLHGSVRSLALRSLVPGRWSSYPKGRLTRAALVHLGVGAAHDATMPVAERYFGAARDLGVAPDGKPAEVVWTAADTAEANRIAPEGSIVLAPGARHATKRWPAAHWRDLAARLTASGQTVVATGASHERGLIAGPGTIDAFGIPLLVAAALMARARIVVANDSGLLHLASAVGCPVVGLFGPTVQAFGFFPYRARGSVLEQALDCRPCSTHGGPVCPRGHHRCLGDIAPAAVAAAVAAA